MEVKDLKSNYEGEETESIIRDPAQTIELKRSHVPFYINMMVVMVLVAILLAGLLFLIGLTGLVLSIELPIFLINSVIGFLVLGIFIAYFVISYLNYKSVDYSLIPGSIHKTQLETIDQIPGKVLIKEGYFFRNKILLTMNDFDRLKIEKSFWGKKYDYGTILLIQQDELNRSEDFMLMHVLKPEEASVLIQKMIDVEIFKTVPARGSSKDQKNENSPDNKTD
jgi:hypothetical protein